MISRTIYRFRYLIILALIIVSVNNIKLKNKISKLENELTELKKEYNIVITEKNIMSSEYLKTRENYEVRLNIIDEKVNNLHDFIKKMYPGYDYKNKIDNAYNNDAAVEKIPDDLTAIYMEKRYFLEHGLEKYKLRVPGIIYPIDPENGYVTNDPKNTMMGYEFGNRHPFEGIHTGVDINNKKMAQIYAVADGEIWKSYYNKFGGNTIELKFHVEIDGKKQYYFVRYRHIDNIQVNKGDLVKQGDVIASIGSTGDWCFGTHLHFEMWEYKNGYWININPFLNSTYRTLWVDRI